LRIAGELSFWVVLTTLALLTCALVLGHVSELGYRRAGASGASALTQRTRTAGQSPRRRTVPKGSRGATRRRRRTRSRACPPVQCGVRDDLVLHVLQQTFGFETSLAIMCCIRRSEAPAYRTVLWPIVFRAAADARSGSSDTDRECPPGLDLTSADRGHSTVANAC
jgi:hypothetical protein